MYVTSYWYLLSLFDDFLTFLFEELSIHRIIGLIFAFLFNLT